MTDFIYCRACHFDHIVELRTDHFGSCIILQSSCSVWIIQLQALFLCLEKFSLLFLSDFNILKTIDFFYFFTINHKYSLLSQSSMSMILVFCMFRFFSFCPLYFLSAFIGFWNAFGIAASNVVLPAYLIWAILALILVWLISQLTLHDQHWNKSFPKTYYFLTPQILLMNGGSEHSMSLHKLIPYYSVFVLTPMILVNHLCGRRPLMREGVTVFTLMVFDECHHTREEEPYNNIMYYYLKEKRLGRNMPQVWKVAWVSFSLCFCLACFIKENCDKKKTRYIYFFSFSFLFFFFFFFFFLGGGGGGGGSKSR